MRLTKIDDVLTAAADCGSEIYGGRQTEKIYPIVYFMRYIEYRYRRGLVVYLGCWGRQKRLIEQRTTSCKIDTGLLPYNRLL